MTPAPSWLALVAALACAVLLSGSCGLLGSSADERDEVHAQAERLRAELNAAADAMTALAPLVQSACGGETLPPACARLDDLWQGTRRALAAAQIGVDAYDRTGTGLDGVRDAIDGVLDAVAAIRAMLGTL